VEHQKTPSTQVYNALLELYLREAQEPEHRDKRTQQVVAMLEDEGAGYDPDHALLLMQLYRLQQGIVILCEKQKLFVHMLECYIETNDYTNIMDLCWRHGSEEATLWIQALRYFAVRDDVESQEHVASILKYIENHNLLPPLMVVKSLAENSATTISVLMDYIKRHLSIEEDQTKENSKLIEKYSKEAEEMREEISNLKTNPTIFQANKCTHCAKKLSLPTVHLLCNHSWHQQCFEGVADLDDDCPICSTENRTVMEHLKSLDQIENLHQQFFRSVEVAQDGFTAVADFFAKGVFNKPVILDSDRKRRPRVTRGPSMREIEKTRSASAISTTGRPRSQPVPKSAPNPFAEEPAPNPFGSSSTSGGNPFGDSSSTNLDNNPFEDSVSPVEILGGAGNPF